MSGNSIFSTVLTVLTFVLVVKAAGLFTKIQDYTRVALGINAGYMVSNASAESDGNTSAVGNVINRSNNDDDDKTKPDVTKDSSQIIAASDDFKTNVPALLGKGKNNDEVKLLTELSKRRQALEKGKQDLALKASVLKATESKIDKKMQELAVLRDQVTAVVKKYNQHESAKLKSLVKIYENMKPREAAKIFDELELPVLVSIVTKMREIKVAPVIAAMHPTRAKELSVELAKQDPIEGFEN